MLCSPRTKILLMACMVVIALIGGGEPLANAATFACKDKNSSSYSCTAFSGYSSKKTKNWYDTRYWVRNAVNGHNCTRYVAYRLWKAGVKDTGSFGDAKKWAASARNKGFKVDKKPVVGAIAYWNNGTWGHVAIVEKVNSNGTVEISEDHFTSKVTQRRTTSKNSSPAGYIHVADAAVAKSGYYKPASTKSTKVTKKAAAPKTTTKTVAKTTTRTAVKTTTKTVVKTALKTTTATKTTTAKATETVTATKTLTPTHTPTVTVTQELEPKEMPTITVTETVAPVETAGTATETESIEIVDGPEVVILGEKDEQANISTSQETDSRVEETTIHSGEENSSGVSVEPWEISKTDQEDQIEPVPTQTETVIVTSTETQTIDPITITLDPATVTAEPVTVTAEPKTETAAPVTITATETTPVTVYATVENPGHPVTETETVFVTETAPPVTVTAEPVTETKYVTPTATFTETAKYYEPAANEDSVDSMKQDVKDEPAIEVQVTQVSPTSDRANPEMANAKSDEVTSEDQSSAEDSDTMKIWIALSSALGLLGIISAVIAFSRDFLQAF